MKEIRIVLADDSAVIRRLVGEVIRLSPGMKVVGTAKNGREAVELVETEKPDAVLLDIEMPEMDGLAALEAIRRKHPKLPVVMFSTLVQHGAQATVDALSRGASDYVAKPTGGLNVSETLGALRQRVAPLLEALCREEGTEVGVAAESSLDVKRACDVVVVAASTGGPVALGRMLEQVNKDFALPIVVVQHMPVSFTRHFATQLGTRIALPVVEAEDKTPVRGPGVWIAPGGLHLKITGGPEHATFSLSDEEPVHSVKPAADILFESAAKIYGARVLGVVLTGMGVDGLAGARAVQSAGGHVWTQDARSSVVWGMPGAVVKARISETNAAPEVLGQLLEGKGSAVAVGE